MPSDTAAPRPVEIWDIGRLVPYAKNTKKHPQAQIDKLAKSMKRLGITPIQVEPDGTIIAGHGRRLAALKLGLTKVPVDVRYDLTKEEAQALRIADNTAASTDYDAEMMKEEVIALDALGLSDVLGLDEAEIERMTADLEEMNDDVFVEDITEAVEEQKSDNAKKEAEADASTAPIADALGFKRVTIAQSRRLRELMSKAETIFGKKGADAVIDAIEFSISQSV